MVFLGICYERLVVHGPARPPSTDVPAGQSGDVSQTHPTSEEVLEKIRIRRDHRINGFHPLQLRTTKM